MDITDALMTAAHFHDMEKPQRNSDGDTMREAATEIHKLRAERDALRSPSTPGVNDGVPGSREWMLAEIGALSRETMTAHESHRMDSHCIKCGLSTEDDRIKQVCEP